MKVKSIALFSGGLDSLLAAKVIMGLGIEVLGVTFETPFFSAKNAQNAAVQIGVPLSTVNITEEHLEMLKAPRYGYGKNMNPCIDCHTLMLKMAGRIMEQVNADFIFTGEVLGQRPMSQNRQSLHVVSKNSGYEEYILRPLSAKLLTETKPEIDGKINRELLLDIQGKSRKPQLALAKHYGITKFSSPAGGCLLTDPSFSKRLKDLFDQKETFDIRDIELLKLGRHFRIASNKVIVGRNSSDNEAISRLIENGDTLIHMAKFAGPTVLIPDGCDEQTLLYAAAICALYSSAPKDSDVDVVHKTGQSFGTLKVRATKREDIEDKLI